MFKPDILDDRNISPGSMFVSPWPVKLLCLDPGSGPDVMNWDSISLSQANSVYPNDIVFVLAQIDCGFNSKLCILTSRGVIGWVWG